MPTSAASIVAMQEFHQMKAELAWLSQQNAELQSKIQALSQQTHPPTPPIPTINRMTLEEIIAKTSKAVMKSVLSSMQFQNVNTSETAQAKDANVRMDSILCEDNNQ